MVRAPETVPRRERRVGARRPSRPSGWRKRGRENRRSQLVAVPILLCAVVSALVAADHQTNAGEIRGGVSVGDVYLGGKTPEEARGILTRSGPETFAEIRLSGPRGDFAVPTEELGARLDARATAEKAYAVGRRGVFTERLGERIRAPFGVGVPAEVRYRSDAARAKVEGLAARVNREPKDATVEISGTGVRVAGSDEGYRLDAATTAANLGRALENLSGEAEMSGEALEPEVTTAEAEAVARDAREAVSGPLVLTASGESWALSPADVGSALAVSRQGRALRMGLDRDRLRERMAPVYADLAVEPVEAGYDVGAGATPQISVTPGREGRSIEEEELFDAIADGLFRGMREYEVPVAVARPGLTTAEAEAMKPTQMLGSYRTDYSVVPDDGTRVENLGISSGAVNGTLLAPTETFSMLDHVAGLDYNDSKVIVGGEETTADGGGLCQVTSTLYNAANFAGLDVTERTPHSAQLPYIRPGMDATVWWGGPGASDDLDMKFRNTTEGYLLLREHVAEDGHVYAEVWGRPDNTEVEMRSKPVYMGDNGSEWVTRQKITRGGEVVFDGVLHRDAYDPLVDGRGEPIPPPEVPVAPVTP
jgi:vancomycin resistance protein YoaR